MSLLKHASFQILSAQLAEPQSQDRIFVRAHRANFSDVPIRPGYLYVRSRAISSRTNDNFDQFPAEEIAKGYKTFIGKPVFVNHNNNDHRRARGVIVGAALHEDRNPDGSPDTWVELLHEVDAIRFPKLAKAILSGEIARTSMGCDVEHSLCSFCGNKAFVPSDYCNHIKRLKGKRIRRHTASGTMEDVLVSEICMGLKFFENSLLVEEPADPTAYFLGVDASGLSTTAIGIVDDYRPPVPPGYLPREGVGIASETEYDPFAPAPDSGICPECYGDGAYSMLLPDGTWTEEQTCPACGGSGKTASRQSHTAASQFPVKRNLDGTYEMATSVCPHCDRFVTTRYGIEDDMDAPPDVTIVKWHENKWCLGTIEEGRATAREVYQILLKAYPTDPAKGQAAADDFMAKMEETFANRKQAMGPDGQWDHSDEAELAEYADELEWEHQEGDHERPHPDCPTCGRERPVHGSKTAGVVVVKDLTSNGTSTPSWHVHSEGCKDLKARRYQGGDGEWKLDVAPEDAHKEIYPPNQFGYNPDNPDDVAEIKKDVKVFPCTKATAQKMAVLPNAPRGPGGPRPTETRFCTHCFMPMKRDYQKGWVHDIVDGAYECDPENLRDREARKSFGGKRVASIQRKAIDEVVAPPKVDTLRADTCPVCGSTQNYNGEECLICGFIRPPDMFMDPDLEEAGLNDLRQEQENTTTPVAEELETGDLGTPGSLVCDQCGQTFPEVAEAGANVPPVDASTPNSTDSAPNNLNSNQLGEPPPAPVDRPSAPLPQGTPGDQTPPPAGETLPKNKGDGDETGATTDDQAASEGDPCPTCGQGTLQKDAPAGPPAAATDADPDADGDDDKPGSDDDPDAAKDKEGDDKDKDKTDKPPWLKDKTSYLISSRWQTRPNSNQGVEDASIPITQGAVRMAPRPTLQVVAEQAATIRRQEIRLARLERLAGVGPRRADVMDPANPVPQPAGQAAPYTTDQARMPGLGQVDVAQIGAAPGATNVAADGQDAVDAIGGTPGVDTPYQINQDVTVPVAGTETMLPIDQVRTVPVIEFGNPLAPAVAFPLQGDWSGQATLGSQARTFASIRLARLRQSMGLADPRQDEVLVAQAIADNPAISDMEIDKEISTLSAVARAHPQAQPARRPTASRRLVPQSAGGVQRTIPSVVADAPLSVTAGASSDEDAFAFC